MNRTAQDELEILRLSLVRVAQMAGVETHEIPVLHEDVDVFKLTKQERGWNRLCAFLMKRIEDMKTYGDSMASQLEFVADDLQAVVGDRSQAWLDVIHGTRRQAEFGRKHFPKD